MSNIEDDLKILTHLIKINRHRFASRRVMTIYIEDIRAIDHILQEREQDKARIKELEEENLHWRGQYYLVTRKIGVMPEQKIKNEFEKIQSLYEENLREVDLKKVEKIDRKILEGIRLEAQRDFARNLLQESEDK